jgi:hypothetical protein
VRVAGLILLLGVGCNEENSRAQQARALLERIARIDHRAPLTDRHAQVDALRTLPLKENDLVTMRDVCAAAHGGLVAAESEQAEVRARIDSAGTKDLPQAELSQLGQRLAQAAEKLRKANEVLPDCESRTRTLLERYR